MLFFRFCFVRASTARYLGPRFLARLLQWEAWNACQAPHRIDALTARQPAAGGRSQQVLLERQHVIHRRGSEWGASAWAMNASVCSAVSPPSVALQLAAGHRAAECLPFLTARAAFASVRGDCVAIAAAVEHCLHPVQAVRPFLGAILGTRIQPDSLLLQLHHCSFKTPGHLSKPALMLVLKTDTGRDKMLPKFCQFLAASCFMVCHLPDHACHRTLIYKNKPKHSLVAQMHAHNLLSAHITCPWLSM